MNAMSKPSRLKAVAPKAAAPSKPKVLLFGKPGVGKTWGALDFPSVYYIDTEGGADLGHYTDKLERSGGVYFGPDQGSLNFETVLEQVQALATEEHPHRTLVIDSITKLFNTTIAQEAERLGDKNAFGADKKPAVSYMRRLVSWLTRLDMNVLLVAQEKAEWGMVNGQHTQIGVTFDAWDKLEYELHLALHIAKEGTKRVATVRKSRLLGFPDASRFDWTYDEFANRYGRDVIEGASKPVELANAETVSEIMRLIGVMKLDAWADKVLGAANVASFSELSTEQADKSLAYLNDKMKGA